MDKLHKATVVDVDFKPVLFYSESSPKKILKHQSCNNAPSPLWGLLYIISGDNIIVVGVFPFKRNPKDTSGFLSN